ncbi:hypothetical protein Avbf_10858 [Armadillidium vulgare]|nr:hypothetical protein Avbf_10858 [Armadillidium vulgare]
MKFHSKYIKGIYRNGKNMTRVKIRTLIHPYVLEKNSDGEIVKLSQCKMYDVSYDTEQIDDSVESDVQININSSVEINVNMEEYDQSVWKETVTTFVQLGLR